MVISEQMQNTMNQQLIETSRKADIVRLPFPCRGLS